MRSAIPVTLLGCLALSASISVQASTYAVSTTTVNNFLLTGADVTGWTFSQVMANSGGVSESFVDTMDPDAACVNCSYDNDFVAHGAGTSPYAYSDAQIYSSSITTSPGGGASAIAEVYAADGVDGSGLASNSMTAFVTVNDSVVNVSFDISSYLEVVTTGTDYGFANTNLNVTVSDMSNNTLFNYAPSDFNFGIGPTDDVNEIYPIFSGFTLTAGGLTGVLDIGETYKVNISMTQQVFSNVQPVPIPAAVWLFGSGLLGLVGVARRRKAA